MTAEKAADFWVFAYGSLMWNPGFAYDEVHPAVLPGYHRRFCLYSREDRGTAAQPGLVLGLDRGGACLGLVFHVARDDAAAALSYLWAREMRGGCYRAEKVLIELPSAAQNALAFIVDRSHPDYAGSLSDEEAARIIARAVGLRGPCRDYLENTVGALERLGIGDGPLHRLRDRVRELAQRAA